MHHLQKTIINTLVGVESARFSELRPANIEGNVFTYHLKQTVRDGLVVKLDDGSYVLSEDGKYIGINRNLKSSDLKKQAHSVLLLAVRNTTGDWLLRKRFAQPMYGAVGFVHGEPHFGTDTLLVAKQRLAHKTGLDADFSYIASGLIQISRKDAFESYSHVILLSAIIDNSTDLHERDETGQNFWASSPNFAGPDILPSMPFLADLVINSNQDRPFFELSCNLTS